MLGDLEYACIYRLPEAKLCACDPTASDYASCKAEHPNDCCDLSFAGSLEQSGSQVSYNKPLCQDPSSGSYDARTQYFAKGYPGLRELAVLHDYATSTGTDIVSGNSIVASICPKDLESSSDTPGYGYNPAVAALLSRLKIALKGPSLPRPLSPDPEGKVLCNVVEAVTQDALKGESCAAYCSTMGRNQEVTADNPSGGPSSYIQAAVLDQMQKAKLCSAGSGTPECSSLCLCLLSQESNSLNTTGNAAGSDLAVCQNVRDGTESSLPPGYCYVDPGLRDAQGNPIAGNNCVFRTDSIAVPMRFDQDSENIRSGFRRFDQVFRATRSRIPVIRSAFWSIRSAPARQPSGRLGMVAAHEATIHEKDSRSIAAPS